MEFSFVTLVFYVFAFATIAAGTMVVASRNPVHSVLFLILAFFSSAGLFVLLGAEYLAMTLVIVYVGAVAVLFLFVVMMLDVNFTELREGFLRYLPVGALVAVAIFAELALVILLSLKGQHVLAQAAVPTASDVSNTQAIGAVLYTRYAYLFQLAGLILLVAMIGAITLTLRHRPGVRRQNIGDQLSRRRDQGVRLVKVKPGEGA